MRFEFLTSTPLSPTEGSGTFVALDGLARGLRDLGHAVAIRPLSVRTHFHTLDRWLYNLRVAARPPDADVTVGVDLDGPGVLLRVNPDIARALQEEERGVLNDLKNMLQRDVIVKSDVHLHHEQFDVMSIGG